MNTALVCDYFLDYIGGAQTSMREQQLALTAAGHRVVMVSAARRGHTSNPDAAGGSITIVPLLTLPGLDLPVIPNSHATRVRLRQLFLAQAVDVVHVQSEFGLAHAAADVAAALGIPVIHTVHTFYWASAGRWHAPLVPLGRSLLGRLTGSPLPRRTLSTTPIDNLLRTLTLGMALRADAVISPSAHQAQDLKVAGVLGPIAVIPNPVATSSRPASALTVSKTSHPRFLWVARCEAVKRPLPFAEAAIEALARLAADTETRATGATFSVDFVGDGAQLSALRTLVAEHPQLRVHGALAHSSVLDLMDTCSAVVLTSVGFDNQPMTIAEAVSRKRGVLYCDPKLREGLAHAGYLSSNPEVSGLSDALVALVSDPDLLQNMSRGAAGDGAQFSPAVYVARFVELVGRTQPGGSVRS
ncbi:MAG: glycosyltransferase family 4 protein [Microbacteriaceae bacterium]|nr:glycosyltransferase family 4 protein [Microbacteriaceae bacterium]